MPVADLFTLAHGYCRLASGVGTVANPGKCRLVGFKMCCQYSSKRFSLNRYVLTYFVWPCAWHILLRLGVALPPPLLYPVQYHEKLTAKLEMFAVNPWLFFSCGGVAWMIQPSTSYDERPFHQNRNVMCLRITGESVCVCLRCER